jgi:O-antigen/teichoic acid export membrane protein
MSSSQRSKIATDVTRGSSALMAQRITVTLLAIVYGAVLARLLGPVNIGLIALANSVAFAIGIVSGVAVSGLKPAMIRNIAIYIANNENGKAKDIYKKGLMIHALLGIASTGLVLLTADLIANFIFNTPELSFLITITAFSVSVSIATQFVSSLFESLKYFVSYSTLMLVDTAGRMTLSLLLFFIGYGVPGIIAGGVISGGLTTTIGYIFIRRRLPFIHSKLEDTEFSGYKELFSFSLFYGVGRISYRIYELAPNLILGYYLTPEVVGYFSYANNIANRPSMLGFAFYTTLLPSMSETWAKEETSLMKKTYLATMKYLMIFSAFFSMMLIVFANEIILILAGPNFLPSVPLLQILSLVSIFRIIDAPVQSVLLATKKLDGIVYPSILRSVVTIGFLLLLVPQYGAIITAIIVVVGRFVAIVLNIIFANREISAHIPPSYFVKPIVCLLISSSILLLPIVTNLLVFGLIKLFSAPVIFLISVILTSALVKEDIKTIELIEIKNEFISKLFRKSIKVISKLLR